MLERRKCGWAYSTDGERAWGPFDTRDEALAAGVEDARDLGCHTVHVGECEFYYPWLDPNDVMETLANDAYYQCDDASDSWLDDVTDEQSGRLGALLNETLHEWLVETGNVPDFYTVELPEEVEVDAEE